MALHLVLFLIIALIPSGKREEEEVVVIQTEYAKPEEPPEEELVEPEKIEISMEKVEVQVEEVSEEVMEEEIMEVSEEVMEEVTEMVDIEEFVPMEEAFDATAVLGLAMGPPSSSGAGGSLISGRLSASGRRKAAGAKNTKTINDALRWLAEQQTPQGTWPKNAHPNAINGAAALAFLDNGNSTTVGKYKDVVAKFVNYYLDKEPADSGHGNHGHATPFVIMAMCDAYVMDSENERLGGYCERAVGYVCKTQLANGGWSGGAATAKGEAQEVDVAQSAWFVMALVSAQFAGIDVPQENLDRAKKLFMELAAGEFKEKIKVTSHGGQDDFFDRPYSVPSYAATILIFLGVEPDHPLVKKNASEILKGMPKAGERNYWQLYNQGLGLFQMGAKSKEWQEFSKSIIPDISKNSLNSPIGAYWNNAKIFNNKNGASDTGARTNYWGDCGATAMAMAILNLQVFYRYGYIQAAYRELNK